MFTCNSIYTVTSIFIAAAIVFGPARQWSYRVQCSITVSAKLQDQFTLSQSIFNR